MSLNILHVILFVSNLLIIHDHITHALRFHSSDMNATSREIQFQPFLHSHSLLSLNTHRVILYVSHLLIIHDHITHALRFHSSDMNAMSREIQFQPFLHSHFLCPWIHTRGYYLETSPDPIAMVIRVELFTHKPSETNWHCMVTHVSSVCRACG